MIKLAKTEPAAFEAENNLSGGAKLNRLLPVDALRGLIIVVMALDHANLFVAQQHSRVEHWGLPLPEYDSALPFLTRFVTHIAAPGFFFLMGIGMLLFAQRRQDRGWSKWVILRHFWLRGLVLIALQLLIVNRAWELSQNWGLNIYIGVLFALGGAMILGSLMLWLRPTILLLLAGALFVGTELIHPDPSQWGQIGNDIASLLLIHPAGDNNLWSNYPILPWLELVIFGMFFAHWLRDDSRRAYQRGLILGCSFLIIFVLLRWFDGFGNIRPRAGDSWIDFLNVVKYPPSMTFTMLTMAINLVALWAFSRIYEWRHRVLEPLAIFGRTPLFFYVLHLFLYALMGRLFTPSGTTIPIMYLYWIIGLLILFPLCLWFGRFKRNQPTHSPVRYF